MVTSSLNVPSSFNKSSLIQSECLTHNPPRIYAACYASLCTGILHGAWIKALQEPEAILAEISVMLSKSSIPNATAWFISETDQFGDLKIESNEGISSVCEKAKLVLQNKQDLPPSTVNSAMPVKPQTPSNSQSLRFQEALNVVNRLGLNVEVCGTWIWASGYTLPASADALVAAGFCWSGRKGSWYLRPEDQKRTTAPHTSWSMDKIRGKYGSDRIPLKQQSIGTAG